MMDHRNNTTTKMPSTSNNSSRGVYLYNHYYGGSNRSSNRQDLSLTATGLTTPSHGIATSLHPPLPSQPHLPLPSSITTTTKGTTTTSGNSLRLSSSDSKAVHIMMMSKRGSDNKSLLLQRRYSEDIVTPNSPSQQHHHSIITTTQQPTGTVKRPPSSRLIMTALGGGGDHHRPLASSSYKYPNDLSLKDGRPLLLPPIAAVPQTTGGNTSLHYNNELLYTIEQESTTTDCNDDEEEKERQEVIDGDSTEDTSDSLIDSESEDDAHLISGVGFHDDSEGSQPTLMELDFPSLTTHSSTNTNKYPATLLMESHLNIHQSRAQGIGPSGHNVRVNNIIRCFEIKGPLDVELLQKSIDSIVKLHPILMARFIIHSDGKCYWENTPKEEGNTIKLDQSISYEKPSELITLSRRKIFDLRIEHKVQTSSDGDKRGGTTSGCHDDIDDRLSIVSYKEENSPKTKRKMAMIHLAPLQKHVVSTTADYHNHNKTNSSSLMTAKLITKTTNEHLLILSFSTIAVDFWSSCLFVQQLVDAYTKLEKSSSYRPSLNVMRQNKTRQEMFNSLEKKRNLRTHHPTTTTLPLSKPLNFSPASLSKAPPLFPPPLPSSRVQSSGVTMATTTTFQVRSHPRAIFEQVCLRERQILVVKPIEKLWSFWESIATCTIKRIRGPPRIKVIPPLRIPSGFGEILRPIARPMTSRLRPLTASRQRPPTAKRSSERLIGESLTGPSIGNLFFKVEEKIGYDIIRYFPEEYLSKIERKELLGLVTLSAYVLLLGRCCRGWGGANTNATPTNPQKEVHPPVTPRTDPLHKYDKSGSGQLKVPSNSRQQTGEVGGKRRGTKLDVGSFLIGVDVSLRQLGPENTQGLLGPLTNTVGLRIDLSSYTSFADMVYCLSSWLQRCRAHSHFPFSTIGDELGLVHGLPVRFSHYNTYDVQQLSNPEGFYFMETSVGVAEQKALARMGSCCYLNPLNSKMDDTCQLELFIWEGIRGESIEGLLYYQTKLLRQEIVKSFSDQLVKILTRISINPLIDLTQLAAEIEPPFINTGMRERKC